MLLHSIGTDYEVGVLHKKTGLLASANYLRANYADIFSNQGWGTIHPDGAGLELSTRAVAANVKDFTDILRGGKRQLVTSLAKYGFVPVFEPEQEYPVDLLTDPLDWEVGCQPYQNVYRQQTLIPQPYESGVRHFSGHIHLGIKQTGHWSEWAKLSLSEWTPVVKAVEIGINSVTWNLDKSVNRRKGYGAAGNVRIKPYGVEVRSPSVAWLSKATVWPKIVTMAKWGIANHEKVDSIIDNGTWQYVHDERNTREATSIFKALGLI